MNFEKIPQDLRDLPQWVLWRLEERKPGDKPTKVPYQANGSKAKANEPATWSSFAEICVAFDMGNYSGIGFEFDASDPFCGIDLDGCRDPQSGRIADWARDILAMMATYSEVSPSETGVKLFLRGKLPWATGKKKELNVDKICEKNPAIEVYDHGRYFAATGLRLRGLSEVCEERQSQLEELIGQYFADEPNQPNALPFDFRSDDAVFERARKYVAKMPAAVSGQDGHGRTFNVACVLVLGFALSDSDAMRLLAEYNQACQPPWSDKELAHKIRSAAKQSGERGFLRNTSPAKWQDVRVPSYSEPAISHSIRETTLLDATRAYVEQISTGSAQLISLGIADLDYALAGGVEKGEMIILAARPSHGKSLVGLQAIHNWTLEDRPCAIISEEMAALALGKRTVQFVSDIPEEHWFGLLPALQKQIDNYAATHAPCIVLEGCRTADAAVESIERVVKDHGVQCVVVDYAQLLGGRGKDRYQQMTQMSIALRQIASSQKIVLMALCQMSREVEKRGEFVPRLSDLKETGQLEQDADVIAFLCWPHKINPDEPRNKFHFFIEKNRNRAINQPVVTLRIDPARQQVLDPLPERSHDDSWKT